MFGTSLGSAPLDSVAHIIQVALAPARGRAALRGARAAQPNGVAITLPEADGRRDGSGSPAPAVIGGIGSL